MAKEIDIGAYSAYAIAVEHGYEGTEAEFAAQLMNSAANGALAQDGAERAEAAAAEAEETLASIPEDYTELAGEVGQHSEDIEDNNCVNYLGRLPDVAETTKNGITYSCKDGVFTFAGTTTDTVFIRLFDSSSSLPEWWLPGKKVRIVFDKSSLDSGVSFRIYEYTQSGSTSSIFELKNSETVEYTIPEEFAGKGIQIRLHIPSGGVTDTTATVKILNTMGNEELTEYLQDAWQPLSINMVPGSYIHGDTGTRLDNSDLSAADAIDVSEYAGMPMLIRSRISGSQGFAFYSNKPCNGNNYISGMSGNTSGLSGTLTDVEIIVPENAAFLRITSLTRYADQCRVIPKPTLGLVNKKAHKSGSRVHTRNVAMFGDSITLGRDGNDEGEMVIVAENIPAIVGKMLGVKVTNYGVGSMGWIAKGGSLNAYGKLASVDLKTFDTITLCFGVNDHNQPLGESWETRDETTCMGQFHKCIEYIYQQNPSCRVIVIGPFNGRNVGTFPDYWYGSDNWGKLNTMLMQACDYYWIPYIDQHDGPINAFTIQTLIGEDGVHPSEEGYQRLGEWIAGEMRRLIG